MHNAIYKSPIKDTIISAGAEPTTKAIGKKIDKNKKNQILLAFIILVINSSIFLRA